MELTASPALQEHTGNLANAYLANLGPTTLWKGQRSVFPVLAAWLLQILVVKSADIVAGWDSHTMALLASTPLVLLQRLSQQSRRH